MLSGLRGPIKVEEVASSYGSLGNCRCSLAYCQQSVSAALLIVPMNDKLVNYW